jgi:hypothetical protein
VHGTGPKIWTIETLMQAVSCKDRERVQRCVHKLVLDGRMNFGSMDPPSGWSQERLREQYEEQKRRKEQEQSARSALLSPATRRVMARAVLGVVTVAAPAKSVPTSDDPVKEAILLKKAILRFVAKQWPDVAPETITPKKFTTAARNDKQFLKEIEQLLGEADAFPSRFQIARALDRRE